MRIRSATRMRTSTCTYHGIAASILMGNPTHSNIHVTNAWGHWAQIFRALAPRLARALDNRQNLRVKLWLGENCISAHVRTRRMNRGNAATCRHTPNVVSIARQCRKLIARSGNAATCMRGNAAILRTCLRHCRIFDVHYD